MRKEPIAILLGYFTRQMELIEEILKEIHVTKPSKRAETTHLAYLLHNLYCSMEDLFQEIAKTFENKVEDPAKYHRELLKRMYTDIPGIRSKLLSSESYHTLDELRGFRHIFNITVEPQLVPEPCAEPAEVSVWEHTYPGNSGFSRGFRLATHSLTFKNFKVRPERLSVYSRG